MKNPKIQNLKTIIAILTLIITSIIIYNHKNLQNKIAIFANDEKTKITEIKYAKGTEIIETVKNDGEKLKKNNIELYNQRELLENKVSINIKDKACPDKVENIDTKIYEDNIIIDFNEPKDNGTYYEYLIKNNNKEKIVNYYDKSNVRGYSYMIDSNPNGIASMEINKLDNSPIIKKIDGWNEDYYFHIRVIDNSGNYSDNQTFKIDLPSEGLSIKYTDINTEEVIEDEELVKGIIKEKYDVTNMIKEIENYQLVDIDGDLEGILQKEKTNVVCKYAKKCRIQVHYKNKNTGEEIANSTDIDGYEGKSIFIKSPNIEGYNCITKEIKTTMTPENSHINIYYNEIPKGKIIVKYLDKENQDSISDSYTIEDYFDTEYKTEKREIDGYELSYEPDNLEGKINNYETEVLYYYDRIKTKDENLIKEKSKLVKYVDYDTKRVLATEEIKANKKNKIIIKRIEGYRLMDKEEFDKENSLIDELINSLEIDQDFIQDKLKNENVIMPKKNKTGKLSEYEIVMNCDDSDYIVYYKK